MIEITKFYVDGKVYDELPKYLEKDNFMRPVTSEFFTIETFTEQFDDSVLIANEEKKKKYFEELKAKIDNGQ